MYKCRHSGPSTVDHRTLSRSNRIPLSFWRGCGLPEFLVDNLTALQGDPLDFYSCFISYSHEDPDFAQRLYDDLQDATIRCWFAPEHLKIGDSVRKVIYDKIHVHDKLLLILSKHSVASPWVEEEVEQAIEEEGRRRRPVLFPVRLDDAVMRSRKGWASAVRKRQIGDFRNRDSTSGYTRAFERLVRDLKSGDRMTAR